MLEIKISAPELAEAINNLARAIGSAPTPNEARAVAEDIVRAATTPTASEAAPTPVPVAETPVTPITPVAPTPAPIAETPVTHVIPATPIVTVAPVVPTAAPQYTLEMIANAGTSLLDAGKISELTGLLAKYGIEALTSLDPSMYGAMAMDLRALGAQI